MYRIYRLRAKHFVRRATKLVMVEKEQINVYQLRSWAAKLYLFQRYSLFYQIVLLNIQISEYEFTF